GASQLSEINRLRTVYLPEPLARRAGEDQLARQGRRRRKPDRTPVRWRRTSQRRRLQCRRVAREGHGRRARRRGHGDSGGRGGVPDEMTGILVVRKPVGVTSFDVVAAVRRAFRVQRVGHAGTLDPGASGVLPVLVGEATKLMPYLLDQDKEYRVTARFGTTTDTLDIGGRVLTRVPVGDLSREKLASVIGQFIGRIRQVPPMYSAVHHEGQRLYELARRGVEVEREPRDVVVHRIVLEEVLRDTATLTIVCGKGTYDRVPVAELGDALGVGAVVERLVRTRVGPFTLV